MICLPVVYSDPGSWSCQDKLECVCIKTSEDLLRHQTNMNDMLLSRAGMMLDRAPKINHKMYLHNHDHESRFSLFLAYWFFGVES